MVKDIVKIVLEVTEITEEQIRQENREYNPAEWDRRIDRLKKFANLKIYKAEPQRGYDYTRYFASYTLPDGINLMVDVSYHSSLSNAGFCRVEVIAGTLYRTLLKDGAGNYGYCENDKANRQVMARNSKNFGVIYSTNF